MIHNTSMISLAAVLLGAVSLTSTTYAEGTDPEPNQLTISIPASPLAGSSTVDSDGEEDMVLSSPIAASTPRVQLPRLPDVKYVFDQIDRAEHEDGDLVRAIGTCQNLYKCPAYQPEDRFEAVTRIIGLLEKLQDFQGIIKWLTPMLQQFDRCQTEDTNKLSRSLVGVLKALVRMNEHDHAITILVDYLTSYPLSQYESDMLHYELGNSFFEVGEVNKAIDVLNVPTHRDIIEELPQVFCLIQLAEIGKELGEAKYASQYLQRALSSPLFEDIEDERLKATKLLMMESYAECFMQMREFLTFTSLVLDIIRTRKLFGTPYDQGLVEDYTSLITVYNRLGMYIDALATIDQLSRLEGAPEAWIVATRDELQIQLSLWENGVREPLPSQSADLITLPANEDYPDTNIEP